MRPGKGRLILVECDQRGDDDERGEEAETDGDGDAGRKVFAPGLFDLRVSDFGLRASLRVNEHEALFAGAANVALGLRLVAQTDADARLPATSLVS